MQVRRILESVLYVTDFEQAVQWYQRVLGAELHSLQPGRHAFFRVGSSMLLLFVAETSREPGEIPPHGADGEGHLAFATTHEQLADWKEHLIASGVTLELEFDWPNGARSIYFRDPSNNSLEFATDDLWLADVESAD